MRDIVGSYLNPPDYAVVLCVDEKSQVQALDRTLRAWLAKRPRFHVHLTPTYSSWINQVERWFGLIS